MEVVSTRPPPQVMAAAAAAQAAAQAAAAASVVRVSNNNTASNVITSPLKTSGSLSKGGSFKTTPSERKTTFPLKKTNVQRMSN